MNLTGTFSNGTQMSVYSDRVSYIITLVFFILTLLCYCFFLYFISIILIVYFTSPQVRETSRYILFIHMLINDVLYLSLGLFLALAYQFISISAPVCYLILTLTVTTFRITPYNLAAMALERYLAICYPLRYSMFCTVKRSYYVITAMWLLGLLPNAPDLAILSASVEKSFFSQQFLCKQYRFIVQPIQDTIRSLAYLGSLIMVALVILFTYIKVMLIARRSGSSSSSASKAVRTLMLHAFQLFLCIVSLLSIVTESYGGRFIVMFNFLVFMCLPRLLSPLVYGIRDEVFSKSIKKMYFTIYDKTVQNF